MTLDAVLFLGMMCRDINLEYNIHRSCRMDIMASSAKFPAALLCDVSQLGILYMCASRAMTYQAGETGMHFVFKFFTYVIVTCVAVLLVGKSHLPGCNIVH